MAVDGGRAEMSEMETEVGIDKHLPCPRYRVAPR